MLQFTLRQLEYLTACVDTGSVVAAAKMLNVAQPTISAAIAKLEDQNSVQLLIRHHAQGVVPTPRAGPLIANARDLLAHAVELQDRLKTSETVMGGQIRLGSFTPLAPTYLPGFLVALDNAYPDLSCEIIEGTQNQLVESLLNGQHELALLYDHDLPDEIEKSVLLSVRPYVLLPEAHALTANTHITLAELAALPMIQLDISPSRDYFNGLFTRQGLVPQVAYRTSSIEMLRGMVGQGLGYSLLVTRPPGDVTYEGQKLSVRQLKDPVEASNIVLCRSRALRKSARLEAFENFALKYFQSVA